MASRNVGCFLRKRLLPGWVVLPYENDLSKLTGHYVHLIGRYVRSIQQADRAPD